MTIQINGLRDMHTILTNHRKLGGAIEASCLRLRTGEEYPHACITHIDLLGSNYYCIGFVTTEGETVILNVNDISVISSPEHKKICELKNTAYKTIAAGEKLKYLKRLFEIHQGSYTIHFLKEAKMIIEDIGLNTKNSELSDDISSIQDQIQFIA